jgi:ribonuclease Z
VLHAPAGTALAYPTRCGLDGSASSGPYTAAVLTTVTAGPYTIRGISVGGVYTSLAVPELGILFDAGASPRSSGAIDTILLSHGHVDHIGALPALLGIRALQGKTRPPRVVMPAEIVGDLTLALETLSKLQRWRLAIEAIGMSPGDEIALRGDLRVRAVRTFHPVPSLAYLIVRRVSKLKAELLGLSGPEIAARRRAGEDVTDYDDRIELAYATDTLVSVLDHAPELLQSRVLIVECTFLDERKSLEGARAGCHIHLDEIIERAERFANEHIVLMHVSQLYRPDEVAGVLDARVPPALRRRIIPFVPSSSSWPG